MAPTAVTRETAQQMIASVEEFLALGHPPPHTTLFGNHKIKTAIRMAATRHGIVYETLYDRIGSPTEPGSFYRSFGLLVDWSKFVPQVLTVNPDSPADLSSPQIGTSDRKYTLLQDENRELRAQLKELHRSSQTEEIIREIVGSFGETPRDLPKWMTTPPERKRSKITPEVPVTIWSDWHLGEVVERAEVNGFNEFNMAVAEERIERLLESTIRLCREWHTGLYPGIVVNLLGDFVSGGIHAELKATDEEEVIPAALKAADWLVGGLTRIGEHFKRVYVPCACGNHGRNTVKPEFKRYYRKNFDWLVTQIVSRHFSGDKRFQFDSRPSNDVHYRVYGERYLACHGDMLGVRGGDGIIGSIGPIVRGEVKQAGQSSALGFGFDKLIMGHWHQRLWLPRAIVNNALKGFDEFAMKGLGAKPDRPTQALWFVHPEHGKTASWDVYCDEKPKAATEWISWVGSAA
jgi:hypothetical protein